MARQPFGNCEMGINWIVSVPGISRIPWANRPNSLAADLFHTFLVSGSVLSSLYVIAWPVVGCITALATWGDNCWVANCANSMCWRVGYRCVRGTIGCLCVLCAGSGWVVLTGTPGSGVYCVLGTPGSDIWKISANVSNACKRC